MRVPKRLARRWSTVVPACAFLTAVVAASQAGDRLVEAQQPPSFRAGVDLVTIDVQVTRAKDTPIRELTAADFDISISGRKRPAASAALLHYDEGTVTRDPIATHADPGAPPDCAFGFHRTTNRTTVHYVVGVEASEADRKELQHLQVSMVDKAFVARRYVWRAPVARSEFTESRSTRPSIGRAGGLE
jgi:hypothetical protein